MLRKGFVSNSSSTSFVIALRKGYTWGQVIEESGVFSEFARALADYVGAVESIENIELAYAIKDLGDSPWVKPETVVKWVKDGDYDYIRTACENAVEDPQNWFFAYRNADYDTTNPIEGWAGNGGELDNKDLKVKRVSH